MKTQESMTTSAERQTKTKESNATKTKPGRKKSAKTVKPKAVKDAARTGSKTAIVLELLKRKDGATLAEIAKATDWQNHSIRGFISGQVTKRMGLKVESMKNDAGERTYRVQ